MHIGTTAAAVLGLVLAVRPGGAAGPAAGERPVAAFVRQLRDGDWGARIEAADALGRLGPAAAEAAPGLVDALRQPALAGAAIDALARIGPEPVAAVAAQAGSNVSNSERDGLHHVFTRIGTPAVPALTRLLTDGDVAQRELAASCLAKLGPGAVGAVPALARSLTQRQFSLDISFEKRTTGLRGIPLLGPSLPADVDWPTVAVQREMTSSQMAAAEALAAIGPPALPAVHGILRDGGQFRWRGVREVWQTYRRQFERTTEVHVAGAPVDEANLPYIRPLTRRLLLARLLSVVPEVAGPDPVARRLAIQALGHIVHDHPHPDGVGRLQEALEDPDREVRLAAVSALKDLGPGASLAIPALVRMVQHGSGFVAGVEGLESVADSRVVAMRALVAAGPAGEAAALRQCLPVLARRLAEGDFTAADALACLGRRAAPAVPALARALVCESASGANGADEAHAVWALRAVGPAAVPVLRRLLRHPVTIVRRRALAALTGPGVWPTPSIPESPELLSDPDEEIRSQAVMLLAAASPRPETAQAILPLLRDRNLVVRLNAFRALAMLGPPARVVVPELRRLLHGADTEMAALAATALMATGADPAEPLARLCALVESDPEGRAAEQFSFLDSAGRPTIVPLERLTHHRDRKVRLAAAQALADLGPRGARIASACLAKIVVEPDLDNTARGVVWQKLCRTAPPAPEALELLAAELTADEGPFGNVEWILDALARGRVGPEGRAAAPGLVKLLSEEENGPRAAFLLARVDPSVPEVVPYLVGLLRHPDAAVRRRAAGGLGLAGPRAAPAVPRLRALVREAEPEAKAIVAAALLRITGDERTWGPVLAEAVRRDPDAVRELRETGPVPRPAVRGLVKALHEPNADLRSLAAWKLAELGPAARPAIPDLVRLVRRTGPHRPGEPCPWDRLTAVRALGQLGPAAREALPALWLLAEQHPDAAPAVETAAARITAPPDDD